MLEIWNMDTKLSIYIIYVYIKASIPTLKYIKYTKEKF